MDTQKAIKEVWLLSKVAHFVHRSGPSMYLGQTLSKMLSLFHVYLIKRDNTVDLWVITKIPTIQRLVHLSNSDLV